MKRLYVILTLIATVTFASYYTYWRVKVQPRLQQLAYDPYAGRDAEKEALAELARGKLVILTYGLQREEHPKYQEILHERYGIEFRTIAGCVVSQPLLNYANNYNRVMNEFITTQLGPDVFADAKRAAEKMSAHEVAAKRG